jgi:signal transduction histidine kinase
VDDLQCSDSSPHFRKCSSYGVFSLENAIRCSPEILALGLCATCYTLKRQDAEYFGGLQEQVLERDGYAMLINAKERERSRLASEIHDDFSQRLALMALELENAQENDKHVAEQGCPASPQCLNSASEIGADLHTLSHRLHSSTLERLGLVPGIKALCKEFEVQQGIEIDFLTNDVPRSLHPNVAL